MFDDYPLDAHTCQFQVGSCKYARIVLEHFLNSIICDRLWHQQNGEMLITIRLRWISSAKSSALHWIWAFAREGHKRGAALWCLCRLWFPDPLSEENHAVFSPGLPTQLYVCYCLLGLFSHQTWSRAWTHGLACYALPGLDQHFQQCQVL